VRTPKRIIEIVYPRNKAPKVLPSVRWYSLKKGIKYGGMIAGMVRCWVDM
jgi:hypothetical protein